MRRRIPIPRRCSLHCRNTRTRIAGWRQFPAWCLVLPIGRTAACLRRAAVRVRPLRRTPARLLRMVMAWFAATRHYDVAQRVQSLTRVYPVRIGLRRRDPAVRCQRGLVQLRGRRVRSPSSVKAAAGSPRWRAWSRCWNAPPAARSRSTAASRRSRRCVPRGAPCRWCFRTRTDRSIRGAPLRRSGRTAGDRRRAWRPNAMRRRWR